MALTLLSRVAYQDQEITSPRLRGLLALLAADLRTGASTTRLVDGLWPDAQPENPAKALQVLVSRARGMLGPDVILSTPMGYRLGLDEDRVDAAAVLHSAAASAQHARAGDHTRSLAHAEAGLALWAGAEDGGRETGSDAGDPVSALRAERAVTRQSLERARALALVRLGRHGEAVEPLAELARLRPRDEEILLELLRAEAATAGPAAALDRYDRYRRALRDELGVDPGAALSAGYAELLRGESPVVRHGVPHEPNPLVGRAGDLAAVADLVRTARVTSITGPGGLGKTRLAHAVGRQAPQRVVQFVPLAGVAADGDVVAEVAAALEIGDVRPVGRLPRPGDTVAAIAGAVSGEPVLLVLDNCEHVLGGVADLVRALVSMTKDLRVLITSRAPLGLSSESVYPLPELGQGPAAELFGQRARAARPGVELAPDVVAELCRHLDGLPLAVELAAARVRVMSLAEIARRLDDRFALLRGGARDAPQRHRTLHAVVDWSWTLLDEPGEAAMRALSVFPDGFTADAAERIAGGDTLGTLENLVDQSLLKVTDTAAGVRFRMLETIREFSAAAREEAGENERVTGEFLAWARDLGVAQQESLYGPDPLPAMARVRSEQDNLIHALRVGLDGDDGATVAATGAVLGGLWLMETNFARLTWLTEQASWPLSHFRPGPELVDATRAAAVVGAATTFMIQGLHAGRWLLVLGHLPSPSPGDVVGALATLLRAAIGSPDAVLALRDSDSPLVAGFAWGVTSYIREHEGDVDGALDAAQRMHDAIERAGTPWSRAFASGRLGELCLLLERGADAQVHIAAALREMELLGSANADQMRLGLVLASLQLGDVEAAERWFAPVVPDRAEIAGLHTFALTAWAGILLARGETEAGLAQLRQVVDQLCDAVEPTFGADVPGPDSWTLEVDAVCVVAHARHGRLDLVADVIAPLPDNVTAILTDPAVTPAPAVQVLPICGALLVALAMADLDHGTETSRAEGARLIALAERFRYLRNFQPAMSSARVRQLALDADGPAYADAVSEYAGLDRAGLIAAALDLVRDRVTP
jgi:predicted ATPase